MKLFMSIERVKASDTVNTTPPRACIPLDRALLCLDCESIFEAEGSQRCPSCGSSVAWAIGRALNKEATPCS